MKLPPEQVRPSIRVPAPLRRSVGLGDVVKSVTRTFGFEPCRGCLERAAALNRWVGFAPYGKRS
jgi:hypothetical protein